MRYRSKPSEIEAVQWRGDNAAEVGQFAPYKFANSRTDGKAWLKAGKAGAQGWVEVPVGHWIVRQPGDLTDHWPVEDAYFQAKYEPVEA